MRREAAGASWPRGSGRGISEGFLPLPETRPAVLVATRGATAVGGAAPVRRRLRLPVPWEPGRRRDLIAWMGADSGPVLLEVLFTDPAGFVHAVTGADTAGLGPGERDAFARATLRLASASRDLDIFTGAWRLPGGSRIFPPGRSFEGASLVRGETDQQPVAPLWLRGRLVVDENTLARELSRRGLPGGARNRLWVRFAAARPLAHWLSLPVFPGPGYPDDPVHCAYLITAAVRAHAAGPGTW